jgi:gamma-glutamylcyclotransferase (GGCT)/AIG2-like uncharacterized protein YtfP
MNKNFQYMLFFGSLRKNSKRGYNFDRFGKGSQKYIKDIELSGYEMYSLTYYPAICKGNGKVKFELHKVDNHAAEMINGMELGAGYTPVKINVDNIEATFYMMDKEKLKGREKVESGDWN